MASMALNITISRMQMIWSRSIIVPSPYTSGVVNIGVAPRHFQVSARRQSHDKAANAAKEGADAAKKSGEKLKNEATSTAEDAMQKGKNVAGKVTDTSKDLGDKAKKTAQDAWDTVKDTTQKIKDTVTGKAEETKKILKEDAECAKRSMNKKN